MVRIKCIIAVINKSESVTYKRLYIIAIFHADSLTCKISQFESSGITSVSLSQIQPVLVCTSIVFNYGGCCYVVAKVHI